MSLFDAIAVTAAKTAGLLVYRSNIPDVWGDTNGIEVCVDVELNDADATWLALHLCGHSLHLAASPRAREVNTDQWICNGDLMSGSQIAEHVASINMYACTLLDLADLKNLRNWYMIKTRAMWNRTRKEFCSRDLPLVMPERILVGQMPVAHMEVKRRQIRVMPPFPGG